jgi:hypothetical protein
MNREETTVHDSSVGSEGDWGVGAGGGVGGREAGAGSGLDGAASASKRVVAGSGGVGVTMILRVRDILEEGPCSEVQEAVILRER